jgi:hypothetical protein
MPSSNADLAEWPRHSAECICRSCRQARRRVQLERVRELRRPEYVGADDVSAHIHALLAAGWSQTRIAREAGVATGTISKVARWPEVTVDVRTAAKILAVR